MRDELEPEDRGRLQTALVAIFDIVKAPIGMDEEYFRKLLMERGLRIVPAERAARH